MSLIDECVLYGSIKNEMVLLGGNHTFILNFVFYDLHAILESTDNAYIIHSFKKPYCFKFYETHGMNHQAMMNLPRSVIIGNVTKQTVHFCESIIFAE